MSLTTTWPSPVVYPEYKYKYSFTPTTINVGGSDPNDPDSPPLNFTELFKDVTINPTIVGNDEEGYAVVGEGVLDALMHTAQLHLNAQLKSNRIRAENYAEGHLQMYLGTLQMFQASFIQWNIEIERLKVQVALENKRMELELQIARERNESAERQATEQRDSQERMNTQNITSQEKLSANQITSQEKLSANQIVSNEKISSAQNVSAEKQNTDRIDAQAALVAAQVDSEVQKKHLHRRQIEGFDEDYAQKIFKIQLDSWIAAASISKGDFIGTASTPAAIGKTSIDSTYTDVVIKNFDIDKYYRALSTLGSNGML